LNKYIFNFNWLLVEKVIRIFGGLFIGVWVARYLGPRDFGIFSYALAFIAFFSWLSQLGMNQIIVREITKYPDKTDEILGSAFFMKLIGAIFSVGLIFFAINFIKPEDSLVKLVTLLLSLVYIFQSLDIIEFFYQAKVLSKYTVIAKSTAFLSSFALKIFFILNEFSVVYFALANVIDILLAGALLVFVFVKTGHSIKNWKFDKIIAVELIKYSWPLMISSFLISIHMRIDQLMIERMLDMKEVGVYSIAVRFSECWYFIPAIIVSTLMPYFVSLRKKDDALYKKRLIQLLSFMFWLGVFVGVITLTFGQEVIVFLLGSKYANSYTALVFNIWGGIFIAQGLASGIWLIAENLQFYRVYVQIISAFFNIVSNLILIRIMGISGAAISTFLTYFVATWVLGLFFREIRPAVFMMIKSTSPYYACSFLKEKFYG
jgi:O-antigen/teichoic acid export membrane protein